MYEQIVGDFSKRSYNNRALLEQVTTASCYYCCSTFSTAAIDEWVDDETTALCPKCHIDAVVAHTPDIVISKELLAAAHERWFSRTAGTEEWHKNPVSNIS